MALIKCPDCGRDVSDLAPACLGCGRPIAGGPSPAAPLSAPGRPSHPVAVPPGSPPRPLTGVLRSNLDTAEARAIAPPPERAGFPVAALLVGLLLIILAVAVGLLVGGGLGAAPAAGSTVAAAAAPRPPLTSVPIVSSTSRGQSPAAGQLPAVNGIPCDALESTIFHIHIHLAIFVNGQEQLVPLGVGIGQPWQVEDSAEGPFVTDGSCFYWIHTHTEDGVVHIESPTRRQFTLGDFFAIWKVPLSATQVGPAQGELIAYVNGSRDDRNPADIPLLAHERIQLDMGGDVPPYLFDFPAGD